MNAYKKGQNMLEKIIYVIGYFVITMIIQYLFSRNKEKHRISIWEGPYAIIAICMLGLVSNDINYLAGALGFVIADQCGKTLGWH